jgi:mono/diheme cytochrome c family protein
MVGWVYAVASALTLVVINGILCFMLTPGSAWLNVAGTGREATAFWPAFFNPTYFPSLVLRTLVCLALAGTYALITVSRLDGSRLPEVKASLGRWSARWLLPAFVLMPIAFLWYLSALPDSVRQLAARGIPTAGVGQFTQITRAALLSVLTSAIISAVALLILWKDPSDLKLGQAVAITFLALVATGSTEWAREMLRKPYVVHDYLYSNGVRTSEVGPGARFSREGYLDRSPWVREQERVAWAAADARGASGGLVRGELVFRGECMSCHTLDGYRSMRKLLASRDREGIDSILRLLREVPEDSPYKTFMPPLVGTDSEIQALGDYLETLSLPASTP